MKVKRLPKPFDKKNGYFGDEKLDFNISEKEYAYV